MSGILDYNTTDHRLPQDDGNAPVESGYFPVQAWSRGLLDPEEAINQLHALVEAFEDAIIAKDLENRIVGWSAGAERLYGYTIQEALGQPITMLFPPDRTAEADDILRKVRQGQCLRRFETVRVTRDGRTIDVTLTVTPIKNRCGEVTGMLSIAQDTREIKLAEETIQRLRKEKENRQILMETVSDVSLGIPGSEALYRIADAARTLANAQYAALGVARPDADGLMEFVTVGLTPDETARLGSQPQGAGVLGLLLHRTEPLRISNLADHPASVGFPLYHPLMTSFLGVPIHRGDVVVGSLYLTNKIGGGDFTEEDEIAVQSLGAHAAVAIQNRHMHSRQRALVSGLIMAQEEERRSIAYDLHDGLTQYVMASHAHLESFRHAHETGKTERAQREMDQALQYLKEAVVESRRLVSGLRSLALDDLGLSAAIEQLLNEEKAHASWEEADLIHNMEGRRFDKALETAVYRVTQEALTNARKHAGARQIRLLLQAETGAQEAAVRIILEVRDWGQGFDPDRYPRDFTHVGLQGMAERVNLMGGTFKIQSKPGGGTLVRAIFPAVEPAA